MKSGTNKRKILNDPVHGFITIPADFIYDLVENRFFQRLRNISQLGLTDYVYPGATHSRFAHSLGALYLMTQALKTLREKGVEINNQEYEAALLAILCHDLGHGPFSHALEFDLIRGVSHENVSELVMKYLNDEYGGRLRLAIDMFTGNYERKFFHDLISSQIDMDRLDYLVRDSYYTGVIEGSVGSDRIIKMLNVVDDQLVVDEKGIYSIEKFLIARRFMYWQVYMHKTVLSAERLLTMIIYRVRALQNEGIEVESAGPVKYFIHEKFMLENLSDKIIRESFIEKFLQLDDNEMISSLRLWADHKDDILSDLSQKFLYRNLPAIELDDIAFNESYIESFRAKLEKRSGLKADEIKYYIYTGDISNMTYAPSAPEVRILMKSGELKELTEVSDILDHKALSKSTTKYYLCYPKEMRI